MQTIFAWFMFAALISAEGSEPARLTSGDVPDRVPSLHSQCQVALDVGVDSTGVVTGVWCLYGDRPAASRLGAAVSHWVFDPAIVAGVRDDSRVLVAALFRAPALFNVGPSGPPDSTVLAPAGLPIPTVVRPPTYPVHALGDGVVIVEVEIGPSGDVRSAQAIGDRTAFHGAAEQAAQAWRFLPGSRQGRPVPTVAYLVFGFQEPTVSAGPD